MQEIDYEAELIAVVLLQLKYKKEIENVYLNLAYIGCINWSKYNSLMNSLEKKYMENFSHPLNDIAATMGWYIFTERIGDTPDNIPMYEVFVTYDKAKTFLVMKAHAHTVEDAMDAIVVRLQQIVNSCDPTLKPRHPQITYLEKALPRFETRTTNVRRIK